LYYPEELIWALHSRLKMPDVAIILDVPVDVALKRSPLTTSTRGPNCLRE